MLNTRWISTIALLGIALGTRAEDPPRQVADVPAKAFVAPDKAYRLVVPADWTYAPSKRTGRASWVNQKNPARDKWPDYLDIIVNPAATKPEEKMAEVVDGIAADMPRAVPNFKLISKGVEKAADGRLIGRVVYESDIDKFRGWVQWITVQGKTGYTLLFSGDASRGEALDKLADAVGATFAPAGRAFQGKDDPAPELAK
jgi:hypothetical protein